jgi:hypothetical protein
MSPATLALTGPHSGQAERSLMNLGATESG